MIDSQIFQKKAETYISVWLAEVNVPGVAVAVLENGRPAWIQGFGTADKESGAPITADTIFEAASISKPIVAYAALQLVQKGLLELDRPLLSYFSDGRIPVIMPMGVTPYPPMDMPLLDQVTTRHILTHTTGLPNWPPSDGETAIHFTPGSRFSYSGMAYAMLQTLIEKLSGQPCTDYIQTNIFDPFGMNHSTFIWDGSKDWPLAVGHNEDGQPANKWLLQQMIAGAGLHCSTADLAHFLSVVIKPETASPFHLSTELIAEMIRPYIRVNDSAHWHDDWPRPDIQLNPNVGWGLGWGTERTERGQAVWHWGDNGVYNNFVIAYPEQANGFIIMTNSKNGANLYERILRQLIGGQFPSLDWLDSL